MRVGDTWFDVYARALFGRSIRSALAYDLLYKLLGVALLAPIAALVLSHLVLTSGGVTVTNEAIAGFILSAPGLLFVLLTLTFMLASFYAEQAGLMHIASGASRGRPANWADALATAVSALPRLLNVAFWQAAILLAWLLPLAAIAGGAYLLLLGEHDVNWYLANRPPKFWAVAIIAALLGAVALVVVLRYLVDWALSIPVCVYEQQRGRIALRRSQELVRGHRLRALALLTSNLSLAAVVSATVLWLADRLVEVALGALQGVGPMLVATAIALVLLLTVAAFLSFLILTVYAIVVVHLYLELLGVDGMPKERWDNAARQSHFPRLAIIGLLIALLGGSFLIADNQLQDLRIGRDVEITAHRGSSRYAPENTLSALYQAISDGADYAEIDAQETADGVVVLLHDKDLMRIAGLSTKIWEANFDDLRRVDAGSWFSPEFAGEQIPTLQEALLVAGKHIRLNIEIKFNGHDQQLAERVVEIVRRAGCTDDCVITSLNQQGLARVRELAPEIHIGQIVTVAVGDVTKLDVDFLSMNQNRVTAAQVRTNRRAGLATHVWTINDPDAMATMLDYGVDNIITDEPATLRALVNERATRSDAELLLLALGRQLRD